MKKSILIVDDDKDFVFIFRMQLRAYDADVSEANTAGEALKSIAAKKYDYIMADVNLPDMDGTDFVKKVKNNYPGVKVGLLTGYPEAMAEELIGKSGADFVLSKPVRKDRLERILGGI